MELSKGNNLRELATALRSTIEKGSKVTLIEMIGENQMPPGLTGEVEYIDDSAHIHVKWANGSSISLIPLVDKYEIHGCK